MLPLVQNQLVDQPTLTAVTAGAAGGVGVCWALVWGKRAWYVAPLVALVALSTLAVWFPLGLGWLVLIGVGFGIAVVRSRQGEAKGSHLWLMVASAFAVFVAGLSNSTGSPGHLHEVVAAWLHISPQQAWHLIVGLRKCVHFSAYGLAALAAYRWSTAVGAPGLWRGVAFTLPLACFDEFRQHFAAGREGSAWDVALDMAGAVTFLVVVWLIDRRRGATASA